MNLVELLQLKYPGKVGIWKEIEVADKGDGNLFISKWDMGEELEPTEEQINTWMGDYALDFEIQEVRETRARAYPSIEEQLDLLYHDKLENTNKWADAITEVKLAYPKPEENE